MGVEYVFYVIGIETGVSGVSLLTWLVTDQ